MDGRISLHILQSLSQVGTKYIQFLIEEAALAYLSERDQGDTLVLFSSVFYMYRRGFCALISGSEKPMQLEENQGYLFFSASASHTILYSV